MTRSFYGAAQSRIHHEDFGRLAGWAASDLVALLRGDGLRDGLVVDLGCGSGILARRLIDAGFAVLGVDISPAMVDLAREYVPEGTFECGSLWDFAFPSCVAVTAIGEALNYATNAATGMTGLSSLAGRIHDALTVGGVFMFDVATAGRTGSERVAQQWHDRERWTLYMRAEEHDDGRLLERKITIFNRRDDGLYERTDEDHVLRLYDEKELSGLLGVAGFALDPRSDYDAAPPAGEPPGWRAFVARCIATPRNS